MLAILLSVKFPFFLRNCFPSVASLTLFRGNFLRKTEKHLHDKIRGSKNITNTLLYLISYERKGAKSGKYFQ